MLMVLTIARVKPDNRAEYVEASRAYALASASEAGCRRFEIIADVGDPSWICLVESYSDQAAYDEHLASDHFRHWRDEVMDWYAEPPTVVRGMMLPLAGER